MMRAANTDVVVVNFNVRKEIRDQFDVICKDAGKTRTRVLLECMLKTIWHHAQKAKCYDAEDPFNLSG